MPQPLSRVRANTRIAADALYVLNYPEFATKVLRVIAHWSHIDGNLATILSRMLDADIAAGAAMYTALISGEAKRSALLAAARHKLSEHDFLLLQACFKATKASRDERNNFAHHIWGVSEDVEDALLLMPHTVILDVNISYRQRTEKTDNGGWVISPADFDASKIMVYREIDFQKAVESASEADEIFKLFYGHISRRNGQALKMLSSSLPIRRAIQPMIRESSPEAQALLLQSFPVENL